MSIHRPTDPAGRVFIIRELRVCGSGAEGMRQTALVVNVSPSFVKEGDERESLGSNQTSV